MICPAKELVIFSVPCGLMPFVRLTISKLIWTNGLLVLGLPQTVQGQEQVLIPGDPERLMEQERMQKGIPLIDAVVKDIEELSRQFNVTL